LAKATYGCAAISFTAAAGTCAASLSVTMTPAALVAESSRR
jgi:hypothetical protein